MIMEVLYGFLISYLIVSLVSTYIFISDREDTLTPVCQVSSLSGVLFLLAFTGVFFPFAAYHLEVGVKQRGWENKYERVRETRYFHSLGLKDGDRAIKLLYPLLLLLPCFIPLFLFLL